MIDYSSLIEMENTYLKNAGIDIVDSKSIVEVLKSFIKAGKDVNKCEFDVQIIYNNETRENAFHRVLLEKQKQTSRSVEIGNIGRDVVYRNFAFAAVLGLDTIFVRNLFPLPTKKGMGWKLLTPTQNKFLTYERAVHYYANNEIADIIDNDIILFKNNTLLVYTEYCKAFKPEFGIPTKEHLYYLHKKSGYLALRLSNKTQTTYDNYRSIIFKDKSGQLRFIRD